MKRIIICALALLLVAGLAFSLAGLTNKLVSNKVDKPYTPDTDNPDDESEEEVYYELQYSIT